MSPWIPPIEIQQYMIPPSYIANWTCKCGKKLAGTYQTTVFCKCNAQYYVDASGRIWGPNALANWHSLHQERQEPTEREFYFEKRHGQCPPSSPPKYGVYHKHYGWLCDTHDRVTAENLTTRLERLMKIERERARDDGS